MMLFDKPSVRLNPALPAHIDTIAAVAHLKPIELLLHATSYPVVALTLPRDAVQHLAVLMRSTSGSGIASVSRVTSSRLASIRLIKACPACIEHDEERYGSPVWWTKHQIYGVTACPTHLCRLAVQRAGEGGFNKQLRLPFSDEQVPTSAHRKQSYLSDFIVDLYEYLTKVCPMTALSPCYMQWLQKLGYATSTGNLRWKLLKYDMKDWWEGMFLEEEPSLPLTLKDFSFVPALVHKTHSVHYIKHVLLMAFISDSVHSFFNIRFSSTSDSEPDQRPETSSIAQIQKELKNGGSLREVATSNHRSVSYVKQLALRHSLSLCARPTVITEEISRTIWRKAFYGIHRQTIAQDLGVSVGSVESIIQSHRGLSNWRKHLRKVVRLRKYRKGLIQCLSDHPTFTRNEVRITAKASYLWLYKNDREWLYNQLPSRVDSRHYASVDWSERDMILSNKLSTMNDTFRSLSEIDRELGGHGWLLREKNRLPKSIRLANSLLKLASSDSSEDEYNR